MDKAPVDSSSTSIPREISSAGVMPHRPTRGMPPCAAADEAAGETRPPGREPAPARLHSRGNGPRVLGRTRHRWRPAGPVGRECAGVRRLRTLDLPDWIVVELLQVTRRAHSHNRLHAY